MGDLKIKKYLVGFLTASLLVAGVYAFLPKSVVADTVADLQARIQALLQEIANLQAQLQSLQGGTGQTTTGGSIYCYPFSRNLTIGMSGDDVTALQNILIAEGVWTASNVGATGYFGPITKASLAAFQDKYADEILAPVGLTKGTGYFGPSTRNFIASKCQPEQTPSPTPSPTASPSENENEGGEEETSTTAGITVSLAADNPAGVTIPKGATNVALMKVSLVGNGTVNSMTFKRVGVGKRSDFNALYLYQGDKKLTSGRTINSENQVIFRNLNLDVSSGQATVITLVAEVDGGAEGGDVHSFVLEDVDAGDTTVNGVPVSSNQFSIGSANVGTLTYDIESLPDTEVQIGDTGVELADLKLAATNEDIKVYRINLYQYGTVDLANVANYTLEIDGSQVSDAKITPQGSYLTIVLSTPYLIKQGKNAEFVVKGDITADAYIKGGAGTIKLGVDEASDIFGIGQDFGFGVTVAHGTGNSIEIQIKSGELNFSYEGPEVGDIALNAEDVVLFTFKASCADDIEVRHISFNINNNGGAGRLELQNIQLRDDDTGTIVCDLGDKTVDAGDNDYVKCNDTFTIPGGSSKNYSLIADLGSNTQTNAEVKVTLWINNANDTYDLDAKNLDTGESVDLNNVVPSTSLEGRTQTVKSPDLAIAKSSTPSNNSKNVVGKQNAVLAGFIFEANGVADLTVKRITVQAEANKNGSWRDVDPQDIVDSVELHLNSPDGTLLKTKSVGSGDNPNIVFDGLNISVPKGGEVAVYVTGNLKASYEVQGTEDLLEFDMTGLDARDANNDQPTYNGNTTLNQVAGQTIQILPKGTVSIDFDGSNPDKNQAVVGGTGAKILMAAYDAKAKNETANLEDLVVKLQGGADGYFSQVCVNDVCRIVSGDTKDFEDINISLEKDQNTVISIYGILNDVNDSNPESGAVLKAYLSNTAGDYKIMGRDSGSEITPNPLNTTASVKEFAVYHSVPTFTREDADNSFTNGEFTLAKFKVAADSNGQIKLGKLAFEVTASENSSSSDDDFYLDTFKLYRGSTLVNSTNTTVGQNNDSETKLVVFDLPDEVSKNAIGAGDEVEFTVKATAHHVGTNDLEAVDCKFYDESDDSYSTSTTETGVAGKNVWSDGYIWANGTYLEVPTDKWSAQNN